MADVTPESVLVPSEEVIPGELPEETVLLSVESGTAVRVNETGAWLWSQLQHTPRAGDLAELLAKRHQIDPQRALADVARFAGDLAGRGFIDID
jgi:hypothetical protein